jgi:hypothetical protein
MLQKISTSVEGIGAERHGHLGPDATVGLRWASQAGIVF